MHAQYSRSIVVWISWKMSEYFKSLPPVAKERYLSKLRCLNLKEEDDPYLSSKFVEDLCQWPSVEYRHIFTSFNDLEYIHSNSCYSGWVWMSTITVEVAMFVQWRYGLHLTSQSCLLTASTWLSLLYPLGTGEISNKLPCQTCCYSRLHSNGEPLWSGYEQTTVHQQNNCSASPCVLYYDASCSYPQWVWTSASVWINANNQRHESNQHSFALRRKNLLYLENHRMHKHRTFTIVLLRTCTFRWILHHSPRKRLEASTLKIHYLLYSESIWHVWQRVHNEDAHGISIQ